MGLIWSFLSTALVIGAIVVFQKPLGSTLTNLSQEWKMVSLVYHPYLNRSSTIAKALTLPKLHWKALLIALTSSVDSSGLRKVLKNAVESGITVVGTWLSCQLQKRYIGSFNRCR
jgi:hypothetical protein